MRNKATSVFLFALFGLSLAASLWVQNNINHKFPSDLAIYLHAGQQVLQKENPYQPFKIGGSMVYPPTALLIFTPLSLVKSSKEIWATINILSLLLVLAILVRMIPTNIRSSDMIWLTAGALLYAPFLEQQTVGQINTLVLLGIAVYMLGITNPTFQRIGDFGLAVAISIKITPLVLLAFPIVYLDWRRCWRVFVDLLILTLVSVLFFGLAPWLGFVEIVPSLFQGYPVKINQAIYPSINWLAKHFGFGFNVTWVGAMFSVLVLLIWIGTLVFRAKRSQPAAILNFGIAGMTVSSSLIWYHHLVFLLAPIIFLLLSADGRTRVGKIILLMTLTGTVLIQINRIIEARFAVPPFATIAGYLAIYLAAGLNVYLPFRMPASVLTSTSTR